MSDTDTETQDDAADTAADEKDTEATDDTAKEGQSEVEKWKALARKHERDAKAKGKKLSEIEDGNKSEIQRATDAKTAAEKRAEEAERKAQRLEVALDKAPEGMSLAQVRKLAKRLDGTTQEELEADATELFEDFAPKAKEPDDDDTTQRRPKERLKPGAAPKAEPEEDDPKALASQVSRGW